MRVSEILDSDAYYQDKRFSAKKASARSWRKRCGDNIYFRNHVGEWVQAVAFYHTTPESIEQDIRYHRVFVSDHFFYFGERAPAMPRQYRSLIQTRHGCSYHQGKLVEAFVAWLEEAYRPGMRGEPRDRESGDECVALQG
jgi:hypothetical protein